MGDERKQQKQTSIRAARDWLAEADASLANGSGLKGELKVMLAQAELQRAQEAEPMSRFLRARRWAWRIVPLTAAVAVVVLAWFLTPAVAPSETAGIPSRPSELVTPAQSGGERTEAASSQESAAPQGVPPLAQERSNPSETREAPQSEADAAVVPVVTEEVSQPAQTATAPANEPEAQPAAPAVPAPETQKLMQSAGKVLRQP